MFDGLGESAFNETLEYNGKFQLNINYERRRERYARDKFIFTHFYRHFRMHLLCKNDLTYLVGLD